MKMGIAMNNNRKVSYLAQTIDGKIVARFAKSIPCKNPRRQPPRPVFELFLRRWWVLAIGGAVGLIVANAFSHGTKRQYLRLRRPHDDQYETFKPGRRHLYRGS